MKRYRLFRRRKTYYLHDAETGKQESLRTQDKKEALRVLNAKGEALEQPSINLQIARAYLHAVDPAYVTRIWKDVVAAIIDTKTDSSKRRWENASKDKAYAPLWNRPVTNTPAAVFLGVMKAGTVSTNIFLRRMHNFALDMAWLLSPVIPKRAWPKFQFKPKRAITRDEHDKIIAAEVNSERRSFYSLCWYLGASQGDIAKLHGEDIDWTGRVLNFDRCKTKWRDLVPPQVRIGTELAALLQKLPGTGPLFPYMSRVRSGDRATEFQQRCQQLEITGVTLHSYRYAWAERAQKSGYPERFAMIALGHNSKAVARAYAKRARVEIPALEDFEKRAVDASKIIPMPPPPQADGTTPEDRSDIILHNHPSGDPTPSQADHRMTRQLREAANLMQIPLVDHIVVGQAEGDQAPYFSFKEAGYL